MKVLIVDDSRVCRMLYRKELRKGGYETIEASDGLEALQIVQEAAVDLVVLDIEMPNMDGYEVCERLRSEEFANRLHQNGDGLLPVIFVTSNKTLEGRMEGFNKGANEYITKGFKPGMLLATVNKTLNPAYMLTGLDCLAVLPENEAAIRYLREMGMIVTRLNDGVAAFELLYAQADDYNLVIIDVNAPGMDAEALCRKIRRGLGLKSLPVIVVTDREDRRLFMRLFEAGATDYLIRPFEKRELFARLKVSLETIQALEQEIEARVKSEVDDSKASHTADQSAAEDLARLSTSILHNIGNVLNSVFVSCFQLSELVNKSKISNLLLAHNLLEENHERLGEFLVNDPKGKLLPRYLIDCGKKIGREQEEVAAELEEMAKKVTLVKEIIETQQAYAKASQAVACDLTEIMEAALKVQTENMRKNQVEVRKEFQPVKVNAPRVKLTQVLINLIKNAIDAMRAAEGRVLTLRIGQNQSRPFCSVEDTGAGIADANASRIFEHGFTTKTDGHGFGLSYCRQAVREMGGELRVSSEGEDRGATFTLTFAE